MLSFVDFTEVGVSESPLPHHSYLSEGRMADPIWKAPMPPLSLVGAFLLIVGLPLFLPLIVLGIVLIVVGYAKAPSAE